MNKKYEWILVLFVILFISSAMTWSANFCNHHEADSLLPAIMSLQKLTFYYWGENRFGNVIPFLASWIGNIGWNFKFQVLLRALGTSTIPLLVFLLLGSNKKVIEKYIIAVSLMLLSIKHASGDLWLYANPYGQSAAFLLIAVYIHYQNKYIKDKRSILLATLTFVSLVISFFINLSLIIMILPLWFLYTVFRLDLRDKQFLAMLIISWIINFLFSHLFGHTPYMALDLGNMTDNIKAAFFSHNGITLYTNISYFVIGIELVIFGISLIIIHQGQHQKYNFNHLTINSLIILLSIIIYLLTVANIKYVQYQDYAARYFTLGFAFLSCITATIFVDAASIIFSFFNKGTVNNIFVKSEVFLSIIASTIFIFAFLKIVWPIDSACKFNDSIRAKNVDTLAIVAEEYNIHFVVGDYWIVWPTVFEIIQNRQTKNTKEADNIYGLTFRGEVVRNKIINLFNKLEPATILCINLQETPCYEQARKYAEDNWANNPHILKQGSLPQGGIYLVVSFFHRK